MKGTFDFTKALTFIESNRKQLYHPGFKLIPEDYEIIFRLLVYFLHDTTNTEKYQISFRKDIFLSGLVGCGKTSLMHLMRFFQPPKQRYIIKTCRDISFEFIQDGYTVIKKYSKQAFSQSLP